MTRHALVVIAFALATGGCIRDNLVSCGDTLCPASEVCSPAGNACVAQDQIDACMGLPDGTACAPASSAPGTCLDGVCIQFCGDGVVEAGEQCDDGNDNPADGCDACMVTSWTANALVGGDAKATGTGLWTPEAVAVDREGNAYVVDGSDALVLRIDAATGIITTVAGSGIVGFAGDGGPAIYAQFEFAAGVAVDGLGNIFVADNGNNRIRRIDAITGIITTVAGDDDHAFFGDGVVATTASLWHPFGVAVDGLGDLFIADTENGRVRRVDVTTGLISTVVGSSNGQSAGDGGLATAAIVSSPYGVVFDAAGNMFVSEEFGHRVRRVDAVTGVITTYAGTGAGGFAGDNGLAVAAELQNPHGIALDAAGNLYIADYGNQRVRRVDATTRMISTVAGSDATGFAGDGGLAMGAAISAYGVAVDATGNLFIADGDNERVRVVNAAGVIATAAGTGSRGYSGDGGAATSAPLSQPSSIAVGAAGNIAVVDVGNGRVRQVDPMTGVISTIAGGNPSAALGDGGPAVAANLGEPFGARFDAAGNLYIVDALGARVRRVDAATSIITTVAGNGTTGYSGDGGPATSAELNGPVALAIDGTGNLFISDSTNHRIRRVDATTGKITTVAGNGTEGFFGDGAAATSAMLDFPLGIAVDSAGNLWIADNNNNRVRVVNAAGVISTVAGNGSQGYFGDGGPATAAEVDHPSAVAVDAAGNAYICASYSGEIRRLDATTKIITTAVGGGGQYAFVGDGGLATAATLFSPQDVALDATGAIYVADYENERVRRVDPVTGIIDTVAGQVDPEGTGPIAQAHLANPQALIVGPGLPETLVAGGISGTVEGIGATTSQVEVVAGRYPQGAATGQLARYRAATFGSVSGIAFDAAASVLYLVESSTNRIDAVTVVDPKDAETWTIAPFANIAGATGFADGAVATAMFRSPTGLYLDATTHRLYVADTGNHVIRAIDLGASTVTTIAGTPATLGFDGDGGAATSALLYQPQAIATCPDGDIFIADTGNHRIRRIDAQGAISTVLGNGVADSSGDGGPAATFPVDAPRGLSCDALGNLYASSTATVRQLAADPRGVVDGSGVVRTIYGAEPRTTFPASVTRCLTGVAAIDDATVQVTDGCTGLLVELHRPASN